MGAKIIYDDISVCIIYYYCIYIYTYYNYIIATYAGL